MYCEKCGYRLRRGVKSCAQCGAPTPYNHSRSVVLIILAVLLSIAGIVAAVVLDSEQAIPVLIVDLLAVAAILIGLFVGVKRGFLYGTVSTVLLAAVFALSIFASQTLTPLIYDGLIKNSITETVDKSIENSSPAEHIVDAITETVSRDDALDIIIDYMSDELTSSRKVSNATAYIQLTGIENNENNRICTSMYLDEESSLVGDNYDYRKDFAYALAESWLKNCLPKYGSFDNCCDTLVSLLNTSENAYTTMKMASEISEYVETDVMGFIIGDDFLKSENILNCIELIVGEEALDDSIQSIIWAYLTGDKVGEIVESRLFEPLIVYCLKIVLFLIFALILRFLMSLIMKLFKVLENVHIPYALDLIFGTIEGIASGAVWLLYAAIAVGIVIIVILLFGSTFDKTITDTIQNTSVFRYFYQLAALFNI
ncbi:MAG: hypothetical protein LUC38_06120 [Oscillospiraceae bacterium]|nr:hypothetical protein [Oscillospiraceae bacterium]